MKRRLWHRRGYRTLCACPAVMAHRKAASWWANGGSRNGRVVPR